MVLDVRSWPHTNGGANAGSDKFLRFAAFMREHIAIMPPLPGSPVEPLVPLNNFAFGTAEALAIEDCATTYAHMPRHNFFTFALTQCSNFPPWHFPPYGGFHSGLFPVERVDNSQSAHRMAHPPEMQRRRFFCCGHRNHHADRKAVCTNRDERVQTSGRLSCKIELRRKHTTTHGRRSRRLLPKFKTVS